MSITTILYLLAFIFFVLAGFGVGKPPLSWRDLGFAALTLSLIIS